MSAVCVETTPDPVADLVERGADPEYAAKVITVLEAMRPNRMKQWATLFSTDKFQPTAVSPWLREFGYWSD
ncbi:MAG: hypothetical protein HRU00_09790 [Myxococcales bacterium]|nr:hypothetical protein [Myxococcales bacterium]